MFAAILSALGAAFDRVGIGYMVVGGQAVLVRGEPRLTSDIDMTLAVGPDSVPRILAVLADLGMRPLPSDPVAFAKQTMVVPAADDATGVRIDLILSWTPFESEAIRRAEPVTVDGHTYNVASAEDLVVMKILAGRPRDLEDVAGILQRHPGLDGEYVERWLGAFRDATELSADPVSTFRSLRRSRPQRG
jgi:hypothetical protein